MKIVLNGKEVCTGAATLSGLIAEQEIVTMGVAVAVGAKVVKREMWSTVSLAEGDRVTIIRATQGG